MKKIYFFAALLTLLTGANDVIADTYKVDFETAADTSDPEFRVSSGWGHIVDYYKDPWGLSFRDQYVSYTYEDGAGVDGSKALHVGSQKLSYEDKYDLLVTPKVSGTVSIMVKSAAEPYNEEDDWFGEGPQVASLKFYAVADGERGEEITPAEAPELTTDGFVKYVLNDVADQQIGLRGEYVYIDNFEAEAIGEVVLSRGLKVAGGQLADDNDVTVDDSQFWNVKTYVMSNAEGDYTLSYDVELTNSGEVALNPGDEGYTITIINQESGDVIAEQLPINVSIEPGQTKTANVKMQLNSNTTGTDFYLLIRENVTSTEMGYYDFHVLVMAREDDATAIRATVVSDGQQPTAVYNLAGQQGARKGIVIKNGKKFNLK